MKKFLFNSWPFLIIIGLIVIFFWKFFLKGLIPMPADITVGVYFPWLDYNWGFPTGVPVKNPLPSDIPSLVYPWRMLVIDSLKNLNFPLWNPYSFTGMPLLANFQSATFSLSNIFFLFLPDIYAWSLGVIIQPLLTILFTFAFLRNLKLNKIASLLGGIVFAFCAFNLMWLEYNVHGHAAMWLPVLLLLVDKIFQKRFWLWVLIGALVLSLQVFAGYPQIVLYSLTVVGFYSLFRFFFSPEKKSAFRSLLMILPLFLLGLVLSLGQIVPGWEALKLSVRSIDPIAAASSGGFLPWQNLVTFIAPDFFGNPATYNFWGKPWYDNFAVYVGILPLILASLAIFFKKGKDVYFFVFILLFGLILALPNPLGRWFEATGFYGVKAIAARIIFLIDFSLAILAAFGFDWLLKNKNLKFKSVIKVISFFALLIVGLWLFVFLAPQILDKVKWLAFLSITKRNLILPTLILLASFSLLLMVTFFKRWRYLFAFAFLFLVVFDLFRFGWKYLPFAEKRIVFPTTPAIEFLQKQDKPFRVEFGETIPQNMWIPYGLESAAGYDAMAPLRYTEFLGSVLTGKVDNPYGRVAQVENYQSKLFDLLNIKYVLAVKYTPQGIRTPEGKVKDVFTDSKFELAFEDKTVQIYENLDVLPRAFLVHDFLVEEDDQAIVDILLADDFDLSKKIVLEESVVLPDGESKEMFDDEVFYLEYGPQESIIRTISSQPSLLFVSDSFYPGWEVYLDGVQSKIYRANYTFRAVIIPHGEHEIKFIYNPKLFNWSVFISFSLWLIIVAFLIIFLLFKKIPFIFKRFFKK